MPTYEYACGDCGKHFEAFQSMTAEPLDTCPECSGANVRRLISGGAGIVFKGGGFYQTDYRTDSYKSGEKSESAPAAGECGNGGCAACTPDPSAN